LDDEEQVVSIAGITERNDTKSPIKFDLRVLPYFPQFLTFRLRPGQRWAFHSRFEPEIDLPDFQVEFISIAGGAHTHRAQTLTDFNVVRTQFLGRIDQEGGRLYVFRSTDSGCDLFPAP
jgi:hypothetical protein